jgi:cytochrome c-type biogenesis protein CcmH/NrfG
MTVAVGSKHTSPDAVAASLRREAELHPQQPRIWLALADALDETGDRSGAESA